MDPSAAGRGWQQSEVREVRHPVQDAVALRLQLPSRVDHLPGQHYVVRLTAADGYRAQRSYSVASSPDDPLVELYVQRLPDGEVSTFLADEVRPGDTLEVRGPIGGWFVWDAEQAAVAVGGGTGVVPLVAMVRHAQHLGRSPLLDLVVAARTLGDLPYADELVAAGATVALSRAGFRDRPAGRLSAQDLQAVAHRAAAAAVGQGSQMPACFGQPGDPGMPAIAYVCGSAGFAEAASRELVDLGVPEGCIRVERFGPSG